MFLSEKIEGGFIACFENGWCGPEGVVNGLQAILDGSEKTVTFIAAVHPKALRNPGEFKNFATIGLGLIDGVPTWRICGENKHPLGIGSHTLCRSGDLALGAASLVYTLWNLSGPEDHICIFRQPDLKLQTPKFTFRGYEVVVTSRSHTQHTYSVFHKGSPILEHVDAEEPMLNRDNGCRNPYLKSNWTIMQEIARML